MEIVFKIGITNKSFDFTFHIEKKLLLIYHPLHAHEFSIKSKFSNKTKFLE